MLFNVLKIYIYLPGMFVSSKVNHEGALMLKSTYAGVANRGDTFADNQIFIISDYKLRRVVRARGFQGVGTDGEYISGADVIVSAFISLDILLATEVAVERHGEERFERAMSKEQI